MEFIPSFARSNFETDKIGMSDRNNKQIPGGKPGKPNIFGVIKPYRLMIFSLITFALLSNAVNLVIPKLISFGIDDFAKGNFSYQKIIIEFLSAASIILVFTFLQGILQTYASERVALDFGLNWPIKFHARVTRLFNR